MPVWIHVVLQALGFIVSTGTVVTNMVPPKYQPYVVLVISAAQGALAWYNHYYNPDGSHASVPWAK